MFVAILCACLAPLLRATEVKPTPYNLSEAEMAKCLEGPGLLPFPGDCCHFIMCGEPRGYTNNGWKFICPSYLAWDPNHCVCTIDTIGCAAECEQVVFEAPTCPEVVNRPDCCLRETGQVYTQIDGTHYILQGENEVQQACPPGQKFYIDDCCCEGEPDIPNPTTCLYFNFDSANFVDKYHHQVATEELVHFIDMETTPIKERPFGNIYGAKFQEGAHMNVGRFNAGWLGDEFTIGFFFKLEDITEDFVMVHNGDIDGVGASVKIEFIVCPDGLFVVAGVHVCDRVEDVVGKVDPYVVGSWAHVAFRYNKGTLRLKVVTTDDSPRTIASRGDFEPDSMNNNDLIKVLQQYNTRAEQAIDDFQEDLTDLRAKSQSDDSKIEKIDELASTLDDMKASIVALGPFLNDERDGTNIRSFRDSKKFLKRIRLRCLNAGRGSFPTVKDVQQILDTFKSQYFNLVNLISQLNGKYKKICDLEESGHFSALNKKLLKKMKTVKRKLRKATYAFAQEDLDNRDGFGKTLEIWMEDAEVCIEVSKLLQKGRRKRDIDEQLRVRRDDGYGKPNFNIIPTKFDLKFGENLDGSLDEVVVCQFAYTDRQIDDLQDRGEVTLESGTI
ncbi:unnamed protein product [Owenia fusiformis]|uniref:Uncharacterized protein n=1 Tax=Owenia fusiformis TaxID=6347 RepID=A0A8J1ULZ5_OWEFU|nr:unnamed protein product [Owenia fusiformis]